ncbi:hypothetical protein MPER_03252 [Moniliophthora perniciosa FA553]|nr:hypothetical protein MPER_03252 [Moniliophthora perniciosa FA553]
MERLLATGGHDGHVRLWDPKTGKPIGDALKGHSKWTTDISATSFIIQGRNGSRLVNAHKKNGIHPWWTHGKCECGKMGRRGCRWGFGLKKGVLYTASSDRTVRVWDADGGRPLHTLKDHAHWVTTLALNTDFVLRTGPFDYTGKRPKSDEEG